MNPLVEVLLRGSLLALAGILMVFSIRIDATKARSSCLSLTLLAMLSLPVVVGFGIQWNVLPRSNAPLPSPPVSIPNDEVIGLQIPDPLEAPTFSAPEPTKPFEIPWQTLFLTLYALGGLASLTPSIHSWVKLRRLKQSAIRCTDRRIQAFAGKDSIRVYLSDRTSMPMAWGFFRPIILLPKNANVWTDARLKAVLAHEQAHIERRDTRMTILLQLTRALYWPQPLVWWLASEWQTTAELDCDRRALEQGENAHDYATALYDFAKQHSKPNPLALPMARPHAIEERVKRVLSPSMNASQSGIISTLVALSLFFAASVVAIEEGKHRARNSATNKLIITKLYQLNDSLITKPPRAFLEGQGIQFASGAHVEYDPRVREFRLTHTQETIEKVDKIMKEHGLVGPPRPMIPFVTAEEPIEPKRPELERALFHATIPGLRMQRTNLAEVASKLETCYRPLDQNHPREFKFEIDSKNLRTENPKALETRFDLDLPETNLYETIGYITDLLKLGYRIEETKVVIEPHDTSQVHEWAVLELGTPPGRLITPGIIQGAPKPFLERQGIKFEEKDASATYNRDSHRLLVNNTRHERLRTLMELHRLEAQQRSRIRDTKSQERIRNKTQYLTELTIPELKTTELTLNQTTLELQKLTSRHDHRNIPDELKGINIVVDEKLSETHPEIMDKTFSFHLKNQSMLALLEHVTVSTGTTFEVSRHAVSIQPKQKPAEANEQSDQ